jgi:hypothetical protein
MHHPTQQQKDKVAPPLQQPINLFDIQLSQEINNDPPPSPSSVSPRPRKQWQKPFCVCHHHNKHHAPFYLQMVLNGAFLLLNWMSNPLMASRYVVLPTSVCETKM